MEQNGDGVLRVPRVHQGEEKGRGGADMTLILLLLLFISVAMTHNPFPLLYMDCLCMYICVRMCVFLSQLVIIQCKYVSIHIYIDKCRCLHFVYVYKNNSSHSLLLLKITISQFINHPPSQPAEIKWRLRESPVCESSQPRASGFRVARCESDGSGVQDSGE